MSDQYITKEYLDDSLEKFAMIINQSMQEQTELFRREIKESHDSLRSELKEDIKDVRKEIKKSADSLRKEFKEEMAYMYGELNRSIFKIQTESKERDLALYNKIDKDVGQVAKELKEFRREVLDGNEQLMTELKTIRQEQVANVGAHDRMQENIDDHEIRINKLELKTA